MSGDNSKSLINSQNPGNGVPSSPVVAFFGNIAEFEKDGTIEK